MFPGEFLKKLWARELGLSLEEFEDRFGLLCKQLGISDFLPETAKWLMVVFLLIKQQDEFTKPKKGRPSLGRFGRNKDYKRYLAVNALRREKQAAGVSGKITDKALIKELFDSGHELFPDIKSATQSVSDGKKIYKQALAALPRKGKPGK